MIKCALALALLSVAPIAAHADAILGSSIHGGLYFDTNSTNAYSPATTTVTAGTTPEFSFSDGGNTDSANFGALGFTISDDCTKLCATNRHVTEIFTDTALAGDTVATTTNANNLGATYSLSGDVLTISYDASALSVGTTTSTFALIAPAATPEPSSLILLGTGLVAAAGAARRRLFV